MKLLLDTHAVIWYVEDAPQLSESAAEEIGNPANDVLVSAVVAWEIAIKRSIGKLPEGHDFVGVMLAAGAHGLPVEILHANRVQDLPTHHRDPFDRMLIAQATVEGATIVSSDERIRRYDVPVLW